MNSFSSLIKKASNLFGLLLFIPIARVPILYPYNITHSKPEVKCLVIFSENSSQCRRHATSIAGDVSHQDSRQEMTQSPTRDAIPSITEVTFATIEVGHCFRSISLTITTPCRSLAPPFV